MPKNPYQHVTTEIDRHGRRRVYYRKGKGRRIAIPYEIGTQEFDLAYASLRDTGRITHMVEAGALERIAMKALSRAKARAARKGLPFEIDKDWVIWKMQRQGFMCSETGIPFSTRKTGSFMRALAPSLDRIDPHDGYTKANTRIVNFAFNAMLSDWGEGLFTEIANGYAKNPKRTQLPLTAHPQPLTS